ncbi:hypothetical protein [Halospeciosus flavus]|uniref:Uncharacterized protein n=1 Tax=Halospeciosus flavus TaxID=3032283 RepID=A0ABD5Z3G8_9EURY|nr:hypothetical protein [Halospeciosus flavus]
MTPSVVIVQGGEEIERHDVETWWYDKATLNIRYPNGEVEEFPGGNVMKRL